MAQFIEIDKFVSLYFCLYYICNAHFMTTQNNMTIEVPDCWVVKMTRLRDMKSTVHDLDVMSSYPSRIKLGVHSTSV